MTRLKFGQSGLIPAVVQDAKSGEVLMVAYMNKKAAARTLKEGRTVFYSRSRRSYWVKGETSGHYQDVIQVLTDCDRDTLLIRVKQKGGACHLGYRTCFVYQLNKNGGLAKITQKKVFDPLKAYR